jgi:hypothetical protein
MHEVAAGFRATTPPVGLLIDLSQQTPDETVEEILRRVRSDAVA